ncbi:uncharacterized protein LOC105262586 [Musca domestica]|uniref:Uncharacterized protein LOC105262586 n=1 Tax=Musca domestica TaxID=7370 RepID=A0A1I8NKZ6_MUSDO|nr:uncharacterized protein LOC105262586 [Musca domestica]
MGKRKTFVLSRKESSRKPTERLYQPKKFRWCKFVVIPLLIGFILLLILSNVDFTGNAYDNTWLLVKDNRIIFAEETSMVNKMRQLRSTRGLQCSSVNCSLTCYGGNTNNLYKDLEPLYAMCGSDVELFLYDCSFPGDTMKSTFLEGDFRLKTLEIDNCALAYIEEGAFQQKSVKNLKRLHLLNSQFVRLQEWSFDGLAGLEVLRISNGNSYSSYPFYGNNCLKPLAGTLQSLKIFQKSKTNSDTFDPQNWFWDGVMQQLRDVDFSDNYFRDVLTEQSFMRLGPVESLNLSNCSLEALPVRMFDGMLETLRYLNLSHNQLSALDADLLAKLGGVNSLVLGDNNWECGCENYDFLKLLQEKFSNKIMDREYVKCAAPSDLKGQGIFFMTLKCKEEEVTTIITTTEEDLTTEEVTTIISTTEEETTTITSVTEQTTNVANTSPEVEPSTPDSTEDGNVTTTTSATIYTTTTTTTTQSPLPPTIESTTSTTAATPPSTVNICCHNAFNSDQLYLALFPSQGPFTITPNSPTSVRIHVNQYSLIFDIIHFTKYAQELHWLRGRSLGSQIFDHTLLVNDLKVGSAYLFCLISESTNKVSPFDCKSYYVAGPGDHPVEPWIWDEDKGWILSLVALGICLFIFFGLIVSFTILRLKNLRKAKRQCQQMQQECQSGEMERRLCTQSSAGISLAEVQLYLRDSLDPPARSSHNNKDQYINLHMDYYEELQI